jgi:hypothetical protein
VKLFEPLAWVGHRRFAEQPGPSVFDGEATGLVDGGRAAGRGAHELRAGDLVYLAGPPIGLRKAGNAIMAKLGRALGRGAKALLDRAPTDASGAPAMP